MKCHEIREVHQRAIKSKAVVLPPSCKRSAEFHWLEIVGSVEEIAKVKAQNHGMPAEPAMGSTPLEASW